MMMETQCFAGDAKCCVSTFAFYFTTSFRVLTFSEVSYRTK